MTEARHIPVRKQGELHSGEAQTRTDVVLCHGARHYL